MSLQRIIKLAPLAGLLLLPAVLLGGCSSANDSDLRQFIQTTKNKPRGAIEPLPPLRTYDAYVYNVTAKRSPFEPPVETKEVVKQGDPQVKPDFSRPKEYLESFGIDALTMVGTLDKGNKFWALIKDATGGINRVSVGSYLGKNHGRVVETSPTEINLVEIVPDGLGGWLQRPRTLKLSEKE